MRLHDERWWKYGWSQTLCGHNRYPWALKPSHSVKECVLSNHAKFRHIHAQVEGISALAPFTAQHAMSVDNGISDGLLEDVPWHLKIASTKIPLMGMVNDDNETTWWMLMKNMDNLKGYVGTTCILEPWNPPTTWRHVSYLTMSNFDAYRHKLKEVECWPHSSLNM